jgi:hypothetical protein
MGVTGLYASSSDDRFSVRCQLALAVISNVNVNTFIDDCQTCKKYVEGILNIRLFSRAFCVLLSSLM